VRDGLAVVFVEESTVSLLLGRFELGADIVLFADKDELARRRGIVVAQKVMHAEPEVVEAELREVVAVDGVRIKVVLLEAAAETAAFFVFSPEKSDAQEEGGGDDGSDHVHGDVAAQTVHCPWN